MSRRASVEQIRVRGLVQGVGFRPHVWRLARDLGLCGDVRNDGDGVLIRVQGAATAIDALCLRLSAECPPLARIDEIERRALDEPPEGTGFSIVASAATAVHTGIVADASTCAECAADIVDPSNRRYRYPFTNCTHCGPRLSIVRAIPYDRANTSMSAFPMCSACAAEYRDPADRRFHAQPNACAVCGPRVWLQRADGNGIDPAGIGCIDAIAAASRLLDDGWILAIKGIGGFHLACDATNPRAVAELRRRKRRDAKPLALMARDLDLVRRYCAVSDQEAALLGSAAAPIVLLERETPGDLSAEVAPGQRALGFMLPYSPLHRLLLADLDRPMVMTSGNLSDEPQCTDNAEAVSRLGALADAWLLHDRDIVNRVDDSVVRVMDGAPRLLRRARGYAPEPIRLPEGFGDAAPVLALGGELKAAICLLQDGQAILSQHLGDLGDARTAQAFEQTVALYRDLFGHRPGAIAVDLHPDYRSSLRGRDWALEADVPLIAVQHHFAHLCGVLADNAWPLDAGPVLGIILDGLGQGLDRTIWGGELLVADYRAFERVGHLKAVALPGGTRAMLEPWRNLFAQIQAGVGWEAFQTRWHGLALTRSLARRPLGLVAAMLEKRLNAPLASSCGRLFDAVAAALDICPGALAYEGQAAIELEAAARGGLDRVAVGYPFAIRDEAAPLVLDPWPMWSALFDDLAAGVAREEIAARFHLGLAAALADMALRIAARGRVDTVALSGGVFQNRTLLEALAQRLRNAGLRVLMHRQVPANDGALALGQSVAAAAILGGPG